MKTTVYVHGRTENVYERGEELGLKGKALKMFSYACCEVELSLEVDLDGTAKIIKVDGRNVVD